MLSVSSDSCSKSEDPNKDLALEPISPPLSSTTKPLAIKLPSPLSIHIGKTGDELNSSTLCFEVVKRKDSADTILTTLQSIDNESSFVSSQRSSISSPLSDITQNNNENLESPNGLVNGSVTLKSQSNELERGK